MKIRREAKSKTIMEKLALSQSIADGAAGVAALTPIAADLTALATGATGLKTAQDEAANAANLAKAKTEVLHTKETEWDEKLELLLTGIEHLPAVTQDMIEALGLQVYTRGGAPAVGDLPAPENLHVSEGDHSGELDVAWDPVRGARGYIIETTTTLDVPASWKQAALVTRSSASLTGLTTGTVYGVRVKAFGPAGNGAVSNPAPKVAP